jgi:hypothetical protein
MKTTSILSFLFLCIGIQTTAQWSNDPANPLLISNTTNLQLEQQSWPDGQGGAYTFWRDSRAQAGKFEDTTMEK